MKRTAAIFLTVLGVIAGVIGGLGSSASAVTEEITVVSREDGSGTRGAFIELMGIEAKSEGGARKDMTTKEAVIANKTDVMLLNISKDPNAIGYISLGSLNDTVKALAIDGTQPTTDNVKSGAYKIARPFIIATKGAPGGAAKDFIDFILSAEGQKIVGGSGYIPATDQASAYPRGKHEGKVTVAGSSSVTPVMEKLREAYIALNPSVAIEVQMSDSTAGMTAAIDGIADIGMSSRALKEGEAQQLIGVSIAIDGIAVIVNRNNPLNTLTSEQVQKIFKGETTAWNKVQ